METEFIRQLKTDLVFDEGYRLDVYRCSADKRTVGVGHMLTPVDPEWSLQVGETISKERCEDILDYDIERTLDECEVVFKKYPYLPEPAQLVCANMMFNLGQTRLRAFKKFIAALEQDPPDFVKAAAEMKDSRWHEQLPNRSNRLISRMLKLADLTLGQE